MTIIRPKSLTRRRAIQTITAICCCASSAAVARPRAVDQITDAKATAATNMFRFEPNFLPVAVGEEVAFLNSRGEHTVHSVPQLWPAKKPPVAISNQPEARVIFEEEGFYGFRCRRHGQYGMVMLVVAGAPGASKNAVAAIEEMRARPREKKAFADLIARYDSLRA